jgi:hypothetical protein
MQPQQPWLSPNPSPAQLPVLPPPQPLPPSAPLTKARASHHWLWMALLWLFFAICIGVAVALLALPAGRNNKQDNQRKTDLAYIASQAETFYGEQGYYPTPTELSSPILSAFSAGSLKQADFKDPTGTTSTLASTPAKNVFAYEVSPTSCDNVTTNCTHFKLVATLSTGKTYALSSKH